MKPHIKDFLEFLENKGEKRVPLKVKLLNPDDFEVGPEDLNVEGDLYLHSIKVKQLPDNLQVGGDLWLSGTSIQQLPDNLKVGRHLVVPRAPITHLPYNLQVEGGLDLHGTPISWIMFREQIRKEVEDKGGYVKGRIHI